MSKKSNQFILLDYYQSKLAIYFISKNVAEILKLWLWQIEILCNDTSHLFKNPLLYGVIFKLKNF